jgi:hypothetical protein
MRAWTLYTTVWPLRASPVREDRRDGTRTGGAIDAPERSFELLMILQEKEND